MNLVPLSSLKDGDPFIIPHRKPGENVGRLLRLGQGSAYVDVSKVGTDDVGREKVTWARGAMVLPCTEAQFAEQGFTSVGKTPRQRSTVESPVKIVWALCEEYGVHQRDKILEEATAQGVNRNTALTQYYKWRKQTQPKASYAKKKGR